MFGEGRPTDECRHGSLLSMKRGPACALLIWCLEFIGLLLSLQSQSGDGGLTKDKAAKSGRDFASVKLLGCSSAGRSQTWRPLGRPAFCVFAGSPVPTSSLLCGWREVKDAATYTLVQVSQTRYLTDTLAETERTHSLRRDNQLIWIRFSDGQGSQTKVTEKLTSCIWMRYFLKAYQRGFIISPFLNV